MAEQSSQLTPAQLSKTPSIPPPSGEKVDFDIPNQLGNISIVVSTVFFGVTLLVTAIRVYIKTAVHKKATWDDATYTLGLIGTIFYWIILILEVVKESFGRHFWNVPLSVVMKNSFWKLSYLASWVNPIPYGFIKLTLFIIYWNIFKILRWLRICIQSGAIVVTIIYLGFILTDIISDTPKGGQSFLEKGLSDTGETVAERIAVPMAAFSFGSDLYLLLIPIAGVLQLKVSERQKISLILVFATGIGACICSMLSLIYRTKLYNADPTYTSTRIILLTVVECCVGLILANVPSIALFIRRLRPVTEKVKYKVSRLNYSSKDWAMHPTSRRTDYDSDEDPSLRTSGGIYRTISDDRQPMAPYEMQRPSTLSTSITAQPVKEHAHGLQPYISTVKGKAVTGQKAQRPNGGIHMTVDVEQL